MGNILEKIYSPEEMEEIKKTRERVDNLEAEKIEEWKNNPEKKPEDYDVEKIQELALHENKAIREITERQFKDLRKAGKNEDDARGTVKSLKESTEFSADVASDSKLEAMESEALAYTDPLTGLGTRRALEDKLASIYLEKEAEKNQGILPEGKREDERKEKRKGFERRTGKEKEKKSSLIMIDIDFFKRVNDNFGHPDGDKVLREVARRVVAKLRGNLREGDEIFLKDSSTYRYGGEEITVLLPGVDLDNTAKIAERIRLAIASEKFNISDGKKIDVTISLGCGLIPEIPENAKKEELIGIATKQADIALYNAKETGRNKVVVWKDGMKGKEEKNEK